MMYIVYITFTDSYTGRDDCHPSRVEAVKERGLLGNRPEKETLHERLLLMSWSRELAFQELNFTTQMMPEIFGNNNEFLCNVDLTFFVSSVGDLQKKIWNEILQIQNITLGQSIW